MAAGGDSTDVLLDDGYPSADPEGEGRDF